MSLFRRKRPNSNRERGHKPMPPRTQGPSGQRQRDPSEDISWEEQRQRQLESPDRARGDFEAGM